jgi:hypothetical protein
MVRPGSRRALCLVLQIGVAMSAPFACNSVKDRGAGVSPVDRNWAQWPAPNSSAEVTAGAPNREAYADRGDGTVSDAVTGLTWQQSVPAARFGWSQAISYCSGLTLAGRADWRLPTYVELLSLVDYSQSTPAIDGTFFPNTPADFFWTATPLVGMANGAWFVNLTSGSSSDYPHNDVSNMYAVRCVRTPAGADPPAGRYTVVNTTVYDAKTKLTWQQFEPATPYTWSSAKAFCASLGLNGAGWRLPTVKELVTLVDVSKQTSPSIDTTVFLGAAGHYFWSSTPLVREPGSAWLVNFSGGATYAFGDITLAYDVRCVR